MAVFSTGVLFLVAKLLKPTTIVYPLLFGVLGVGWHVSIYNLSHLSWVAGVFGNGFYLMGGILDWPVTKHIRKQFKSAPSGLVRS